jgi:8-oxo-dGTP pyrophosphatase MutT (NUDIX family)
MRATSEALRLVTGFAPSPEEEKSHELILALLEQTEAPFSRRQFHPGHITCTALVLDPDRRRVLLVYHHRLRRWLLPGGHVEETDAALSDTAHREAVEETSVRIGPASTARLAGMDVHAIPAHRGKDEPLHLHHDLIFAMMAESDAIERSEEAPDVAWCALNEFERYDVPSSIVRATVRVTLAGL